MLEIVEFDGEDGEPQSWRAAYDAIGRRLWTECGGRSRGFYWDGDRLAAEIYAGHEAIVPLASPQRGGIRRGGLQ